MEKKRGILDISVMAAKVVLCILLVFSAFVLIYYGVINKGDTLEKESVRFIERWTVSDSEGDEFTTGRTYVVGNDDQKNYTITTTLPQDIKDNEYLCFYTRREIEVYINGKLRKDFVENRDVNIPGGSIKKFYMLVPLTDADSGAEVKMIRTSAIKDGQIVPETFIGTRSGAFSYLMERWGTSFVLGFIVLIFSVVVIIVSIVLSFLYKMKIDMMYGALGIAVIASWIITDSFLYPFIFGTYHVNGILNYMICFMIPFAPAIYLNSVQGGRYKKSMSAILLISALNAIIWPVLHFTGIRPFYHTTTVINLILTGVTSAAILILIIDAIRKKNGSYKYTFIGFLGFLVCCIIELLIILTVTTTNEALPMVIGLAFLLVFVVIQQVNDIRIINMEKQRAIDMSEAKTRFLASMSHEIRTPINAILGMNEMILRENKDKAVEDYSRNIKASGKMLLMLVNDVLDFSKIESGKLEIHENRFLMSDMLYDVISLVKERSDEKGLELTTKVTGEVPNELSSDEFRIRQILVNLMNNAVKYTDRGTVTLEIGGEYTEEGTFSLKLSVSDTGKGIREEDQPHLFEAFSRADAKANINIEGTGLGLAIVKSIVDSMNGTLGVESEYGVGSLFWVQLPVKYREKDPLKKDFLTNRSESEAVTDVCSFSAPDAKILVVDDNQSNLTIVKLFLKRTGIKPDLCSTGTRAIELCKNTEYDLIFLDHMMPHPDGIETLRVIRNDSDSLNKETKVVVLTANAVAGSRQMYMDAGFDDYLTKPLDSKLLEQTVRKMLPKDKVKEGSADENVTKVEKPVNTMKPDNPVKPDNSVKPVKKAAAEAVEMSSIRKRLTAIEGLDYETALCYCAGDEEILEEIISDVVTESAARVERMRKNLEAKDYNAYRIDAHSIKSSMATLGLDSLSERAKKHEFAAKEDNIGFILEDAEDFMKEYTEVCRKMEG